MLRCTCLYSAVALLGFAVFHLHTPVAPKGGGPIALAMSASQKTAAVAVAPAEDLTGRTLADITSHVVRFTITNRGSEPDVFHLACSGFRIRCDGVRPAQVRLQPGAHAGVVVVFETAGAGRGVLALTAFSPITLARGVSPQVFSVERGGRQP
jgi:hypothetical protein